MSDCVQENCNVEFLMGEYNHTIDAKGRMNFPTKLKAIFGSSFVVTRGFDGCLAVYTNKDWIELVEKVKALPATESRNMQRFVFSNATTVEPDKQGRILISPKLRDYAGLEHDVVVIGRATQAEIWDKQRWEDMNAAMSEEDIIETMTKLGF